MYEWKLLLSENCFELANGFWWSKVRRRFSFDLFTCGLAAIPVSCFTGKYLWSSDDEWDRTQSLFVNTFSEILLAAAVAPDVLSVHTYTYKHIHIHIHIHTHVHIRHRKWGRHRPLTSLWVCIAIRIVATVVEYYTKRWFTICTPYLIFLGYYFRQEARDIHNMCLQCPREVRRVYTQQACP
jgi:hypothetical protein